MSSDAGHTTWADALEPWYDGIRKLREDGATWPNIVAYLTYVEDWDNAPSVSTVRKWYAARSVSPEYRPDPSPEPDDPPTESSVNLTERQATRIRSVDDLCRLFNVDPEDYEVEAFRLNYYEMWGGQEVGPVPLYQVRPTIRRRLPAGYEALNEAWNRVVEDMRRWAPSPQHPRPRASPVAGDPVSYHLSIMDAHFGMYAWGEEIPTGGDYDLDTAKRDYLEAAEYLLAFARHYDVEEVVMPVGNDMAHIDTLQQGKVGTTTKGTPQDYDSRLAKIFTTMREAQVEVVDMARGIAPVKVKVVRGNHDWETSFKLGEVLNAWYRRDPWVDVDFSPPRRKFGTYGRNLWMWTHGEEVGRKRDPLVQIMMDEAIARGIDLREHPVREIHTGHWHKMQDLVRMNLVTLTDEHRGTRIRGLPGLTSTDAWHDGEGYSHLRAATAIAYRKRGGAVGVHEFLPDFQEEN